MVLAGERFERVDVALAQRRVFALEQGFEFGKRRIFIGEQTRQVVTREIGIHLGVHLRFGSAVAPVYL